MVTRRRNRSPKSLLAIEISQELYTTNFNQTWQTDIAVIADCVTITRVRSKLK